MKCIFCKIIKKEIPCFKVYEDKYFIAILDIEPITIGHTLLIPKKHFLDLRNFDAKTLKQLGLAEKKVINILQKKLKKVTGFTTYQSLGIGAFQSVMHAHIHIIPRYKNDFGPSTFDRAGKNIRKKIDKKWAKEFIKK